LGGLRTYDRAGWLAMRRVLPAGRKPRRE
jgi:hypothetical protein